MDDGYCIVACDSYGNEPWYKLRDGRFMPIKYVEWTDTYTNLDYRKRDFLQSYLSRNTTRFRYRIITSEEFEIIWIIQQ